MGPGAIHATRAPSARGTRHLPLRMRFTVALALLLTIGPLPLSAQGSGAGEGVRLGVFLGGISTFGVSIELFDDTHAVEVSVGTWSFRDLALSTVYKEYLGAGRLRPFVGGGLWAVAAWPPEERTGLALVLRAPIGADWSFRGDHALGAALNVDRGLWVRRSDPEDDLPMNRRLVPLPEVYYRLTR